MNSTIDNNQIFTKDLFSRYSIIESNTTFFSIPRNKNWFRFKSLLSKAFTHRTHINFEDRSHDYFVRMEGKYIVIRKYTSSNFQAILSEANPDKVIVYASLFEAAKDIQELVKSLFRCLEQEDLSSQKKATSLLSHSSSSISSSSSHSMSSLSSFIFSKIKISKKVDWQKGVVLGIWLSVMSGLSFRDVCHLSSASQFFYQLGKHKIVKTVLVNHCRIPSVSQFLKMIPDVKPNCVYKLNLSDLTIKLEDLEKILNTFPKLKKLDLSLSRTDSNYKKFQDEIIDKIPAGINSFKIAGAAITDDGVKKLSKRCTRLTILDLSGCKLITSEGFKQLSGKLTSLDLRYTNITDKELEIFSKQLKKLTKLNISNCNNISDQGLKCLSKKLNILDLSCCEITDAGLKEISLKLVSLNLSWCKKITDKGLKEFHEGHSLTFLDLSSSAVTNEGIQTLRYQLPDCHIVATHLDVQRSDKNKSKSSFLVTLKLALERKIKL